VAVTLQQAATVMDSAREAGFGVAPMAAAPQRQWRVQ